ncbi:MAG: DUF5916 domain-containing protein [Rhodothermales bacterium]
MACVPQVLLACLAYATLVHATALAQPSATQSAPTPVSNISADPAGPALAVPRLTTHITLDGNVTQEEWGAIPPLPLTQHWPTFGAEMSEPTELRIAYDSDYLYVSCICGDSEPSTAISYRRDDWNRSNDQITIIIDSFDDNENAVGFALYPTGAHMDATLSNDMRDGGSGFSTDWNSFWDGNSRILERGWTGEIRIPWSSIRFTTNADGSTRMGISIYRFFARNQEMQIFPAIPPEWGFWSFGKPSQFRTIVFQGLSPKRPIYVAPYLLGGVASEPVLNETETGWSTKNRTQYDTGLDIKYSITDNLTMDATVNTDFAQIEADNQEVNLTRFSLFFPEKRQFFLERTGNFEFGFGDNDRMFYSRRIGIVDGRAVPIIGGARLVGRAGDIDIGALTIQSGRTDVSRSENFSVVRVKKKAFNARSYVGGIGTTRIDEDGNSNIGIGLDAVVNATADDYVTVNLAQTFESNEAAGIDALDRLRARIQIQRPREQGLGFKLGVARSGSAYDPGVGFQLRSDYSQLNAVMTWGINSTDDSPIKLHLFKAEENTYIRNGDKSLETNTAALSWNLESRSGHILEMNGEHAVEDLVDGFNLSDAANILPGRYQTVSGEVAWRMPYGWPLRADVEAGGGGFFDGTLVSFSVSPEWSINSKLQLRGTWAIDQAEFSDRGQKFSANRLQARVNYSLNTKVSISTFVQYNSAADVVIGNFRFRYNPRDGSDFYLVFNDGYNTDRTGSDLLLPINTGRTVLAKYTRTFIW